MIWKYYALAIAEKNIVTVAKSFMMVVSLKVRLL
jgi:hypothetical protein